MQRVTVTLDDDLMAELDAIIAERGYQNRSEAIHDLARAGIKEASGPDSGRGRDCVAALVYVYDHEARQLSKRLLHAYHVGAEGCRSPRCMCISTMTLASRSRCSRLVGRGAAFRRHVIAERGVRHGKLVRMPVETPAASSGSRHRSHHHHDHDQVATSPPPPRKPEPGQRLPEARLRADRIRECCWADASLWRDHRDRG